MESKEHKQKKFWTTAKIILIIMLYIFLQILFMHLYGKYLKLEFLLVTRILDLLITDCSAFFIIAGFVVYLILYIEFHKYMQNNKILHGALLISIILIVFVTTNLQTEEIYVVDGEEQNRFEIIGLMIQDCVAKETETVVANGYDIDTMSHYFSNRKHNSGNRMTKMYVNIYNDYVILVDSGCEKALEYQSMQEGTTEFTVYKHSKQIVAVNGIPLCEFRYQYR